MELAGRTLYRSMKESFDGLPELGASSRLLGARPEFDSPVDANGYVEPTTGGMSVSPDGPLNLPPHRRPREFGGYGRDSVFKVDESTLGGELRFRPDPDNPDTHGFVEPARRMTFEDYQMALGSSRMLWSKVEPW